MRENAATSSVRFEPLHPASRTALIVGIVVGPLLWLVVIAVAAWLFHYTWAIKLGLAVVLATFVLAVVSLAVLWRARVRQEERYVETG